MGDGQEFEDFRCTIFSGQDDRPGALLLLAVMDPLIEFVGPEERWQRIVMFNSSGRLSFTALTQLDENFAPLIDDARQRFATVPTTSPAAKERVLDALRHCQLVVQVVGEPLIRRFDQMEPVVRLAHYLDGLICTGSFMADPSGRVIFDVFGNTGPGFSEAT